MNLSPESNKSNEEVAKSILDAYEKDNDSLASHNFLQLAENYLNSNNYPAAAMLAHAALCALKQHESKTLEDSIEDSIKVRINELIKNVQVKLLNSLCIKHEDEINKFISCNANYKEQLAEIRRFVHLQLFYLKQANLSKQSQGDSIQCIYYHIQQKIRHFLCQIVKDCIDVLGPINYSYAIVGTGSYANGGMTPYSDFEYFILLKGSDQFKEQKKYFLKLSQLLEIKFINLGETDIIKGRNFLPCITTSSGIKLFLVSPVKKGFSLDIHKNPAAENDHHSLIDTPEGLSSYQTQEKFINEDNNHLSRSLLNYLLIDGINGQELLDEYAEKLNEYYSNASNQKLKLERVKNFLCDYTESFCPKLEVIVEGLYFNAKNDFYRLINSIIDTLSLRYELSQKTTLERINELAEKGILTKNAAKNLTNAFCVAMRLRLENYLEHQAQDELRESVLLSKDQKEIPKETKEYIEIYKIQMALNEAAKKLIKDIEVNPFANNDLCDNSDFTQGKINMRLCQYSKAKEFFDQASKNNNASYAAYRYLAAVTKKLGQYREAYGYYEEAIKKLGNEPNEVKLFLRSEYAEALAHAGELNKAIEEQKSILNEVKEPSPSPEFSGYLHNMGVIYQIAGKSRDALDYFNQSLDVIKALSASAIAIAIPHPVNVAKSLEQMACIYSELYDANKAEECFTEAYRIHIAYHGPCHIDNIYFILNYAVHLCTWYFYEKSLQCCSQAEKFISYLFPNQLHPLLTVIYCNIGSIFYNQNQYEKALEFYDKALKNQQALGLIEHPNTLNCYIGLLSVYKSQHKVTEIETCFQEASYLNGKLLKKPRHLAAAFNNICGLITRKQDLNDAYKAIKLYDDSLQEAEQCYGKEHPTVAIYQANLACLFFELGKTNIAKTTLIEAHKISSEKTPGSLQLAKDKYHLYLCYKHQGDFNLAFNYLEDAKEIYFRLFREDNYHRAFLFNEYAIFYHETGKKEKVEENLSKAIKLCDPGFEALIAELVNQQLSKKKIKRIEKKVEELFNNASNNPDKLVQYALCLGNYIGLLDINNLKMQALSGHSVRLKLFQEKPETKKIPEDIMKKFELACQIFKKFFSGANTNLATLYQNMAELYRSAGQLENAIDYFKCALDEIKGTESLVQPQIMANLAQVYCTQGKMNKSLNYIEKSEQLLNYCYDDKESLFYAKIQSIYGYVYFMHAKQDKLTAATHFAKAKLYLEKAKITLEKVISDNAGFDLNFGVNDIKLMLSDIRIMLNIKVYNQNICNKPYR